MYLLYVCVCGIVFGINTQYLALTLTLFLSSPKGWARGPLDECFVPALCAMTRELACKRREGEKGEGEGDGGRGEREKGVRVVFAEEFGGCTQKRGEASGEMTWLSFGEPRTQFMASESDFAVYLEKVRGGRERGGRERGRDREREN